jgi:tetratricopeptide (TPR) repeat protein
VAAIPVEYLKKFYQVWAGHAMRLGPQYQDQIHILGLPLVKACDGLIEFFKRDSTLEDIIASGKYTETNLFHALHFLALRRVFVFEEVRRVANVDEHIGRLKSMHKVLQGKNPIEVFAYFGLDESTRIADITRFYREFAKSNHPDTLPQSISEEFRKMNHELFSWVTSAHDILSNEEKKKIFTESLKQKEAEMQLRAEDLASEARSMMGRGKFSEALTKLSEAKALYSSDTIELNYLWARLKAPGKMTHDALIEADSFMQSVSPDIKKLALYLFVKGLLFAAKGQNQEAVDFFLRALKVDPELSEARRELSAFKTSKKNDDFLTGDITAVFSNLLKRKKSG